VPVLWSKRDGQLLSTESLDILRFVTTGFRGKNGSGVDLCPSRYLTKIDELNEFIDFNISSAVYRVGAAMGTPSYEQELSNLFNALSEIESRLERRDYLVGNALTESDLVLFATMLRFDVVYHERFGCNRRRLAQLPNIGAHTLRIARRDEVARTINYDHIIKHYCTIPEFAYSGGPILAVRRDTTGA
jgi:putative glutathione S-transferase